MSAWAAGIRLAMFDQRVCILERHRRSAGSIRFIGCVNVITMWALHALTNITPKGTKKGPLARLLRQLRFRWDDFEIAPQIGSQVVFPEARLGFDNDPAHLQAEVARQFPDQADNFTKFVEAIVDYDDLSDEHAQLSAREVVASYLTDPLLVGNALLSAHVLRLGPRA